ncbi:MAG: short chain dehydrogenase, partial [uncultured bacterium]
FVQMKKNGGGTIVNVSSLGGLERLQKFDGFSAYSMSKFGVVGLTECLAVEGKDFDITVNCVAPGAVETQMLKQVAPFFKTNTKPNDVARVIKFLCEEGLKGSMSGSVFPLFTNG